MKDRLHTLWDVILWKIGYYKDPVPLSVAPESFRYPVPSTPVDNAQPTACWINHSTYLISIDGINILTDPIFSERCSPFSWIGPKRRHPPAFRIKDLPMIHYVLISHDHYDHLDKKAVLELRRLHPSITWVVPTGVKKWFLRRGIDRVIELGWWEERQINSLKVTAVPSQHCSGRRGWDINHTLWAGYVVELNRKRFYFVGDTGYNPYDFKAIGEKWKTMDLSLIPIGTYIPRAFMSPVHIEPRDAVRIHLEVGSKLSLAMHWKTFNLADEPLHQPPFDLLLSLNERLVDPSTFLALEPGFEINW